MAHKISYLPISKGKHVFIHYREKIREAEYIRTEVFPQSAGSSTHFKSEFVFKVAGIEGEMKLGYLLINGNAFYSSKDARDYEKPIEIEEKPMEFYNQFTEDFVFEDDNAMAWKWKVTRPEYSVIEWYPSFVFDDNKVYLVKKQTRERIIQNEKCYKTREECMANNEVEIVRF